MGRARFDAMSRYSTLLRRSRLLAGAILLCTQMADQFCEKTRSSGAEPPRVGGFGYRTHHLGHAMLQIVGDTEEERVAKSGIAHHCKRCQGPTVSKFEAATLENVRAQIHAEPH